LVVDVHTHFFDSTQHWGPQVVADCKRCGIDPAKWQFTAEQHLHETAAVDVAIVFGLRGAKTGWNIPNDIVADHVARAPQRLIFFASIDPTEPGFMDELHHMHQHRGCRGVKVSPMYQGVHPHDPRYHEIYTYCERQGLPLITHMATTFSSGVPLEWARPALMDEIAIRYPGLKIILAHLGHPWEGETIATIRKQPNLFADISALYYRPWQFYNSMRLATEYGATGKILFGSDYPATTPANTITALRNINHVLASSGMLPVPETIIEEIIHRDALALLEIPDPRKPPIQELTHS